MEDRDAPTAHAMAEKLAAHAQVTAELARNALLILGCLQAAAAETAAVRHNIAETMAHGQQANTDVIIKVLAGQVQLNASAHPTIHVALAAIGLNI